MEFEWTSPTGILQPFQRLNFLLADRQNVADACLMQMAWNCSNLKPPRRAARDPEQTFDLG
ncbi:hypothetical protein R75471_00407 [Paraburkholderia domus]|nr:hypothetical protein R75471_00407 [Paraburkholderia domus]